MISEMIQHLGADRPPDPAPDLSRRDPLTYARSRRREHDGRIGPATLGALDTFISLRGPGAEAVLLRALDALQGERYIRLAERRPANEAFLYGWLANRIG